MLEDVTAERPTEVELINGSLVRAGESAGVDTPLQNAVYRLVQGREAAYA
jgi:ketopantoate reductase